MPYRYRRAAQSFTAPVDGWYQITLTTTPARKEHHPMSALIVIVLALALAAGVAGAVVHGLLWLLIAGAVVFVGTSVFGLIRGRARR